MSRYSFEAYPGSGNPYTSWSPPEPDDGPTHVDHMMVCGVCGVPTDELEDHADQGWRDVADGNIEPSDINQCDRCAVDWGR